MKLTEKKMKNSEEEKSNQSLTGESLPPRWVTPHLLATRE